MSPPNMLLYHNYLPVICSKIASILKQHEQQFLDKASKMRDEKVECDALEAQKKNLQVVQAEAQSLIEFAEHSLESATDEEVLSIYQQILPRVEEEKKSLYIWPLGVILLWRYLMALIGF